MKKISFIILAAGKSRRMKSSKSKVLHEICEKPLVSYVNDLAKKNSTSGTYYISSPQVQNYVLNNFKNAKTIIQKKQLGTAHAVECASKIINKNNNNVVVLFGDVPLIKNSTIKNLIKYKNKISTVGVIVTFLTDKPFGYGRVIIKNGFVSEVIEERDANEEQKNIKLCNSGILICDAKYLFRTIKKISNKNNQKERFLTDICKIAYNEKKPFRFINCKEFEVSGINSPKQLIDLDLKLQESIKDKLIKKGVVLISPNTIRIGYNSKIEKDVVIEQNVVIKNGVKIKSGTKILSGTYLEDCNIGENCIIGPHARIRPGTQIYNNVKVGNFVEIKNSKIGNFSSISHLSYIGDSSIGKNVNIGAGTITCNYDGIKKNKTYIADNVFVGSNTSLIAPIKINKNAKIGAGSVITRDIPKNSLAIERSKLSIKKKIKK